MTSVLAVYNRAGRCVGVCDARCHNAKQPSELKTHKNKFVCKCVCGGANHAGGQAHAIKNHDRGIGQSADDLAHFADVHGLAPADLVVIDRLRFRDKTRARVIARSLFEIARPSRDDLFYKLDRQGLRVGRILNPHPASPGGTVPDEAARRGCPANPPPRDSSE